MSEHSCTLKIDDVNDVNYLLHVFGEITEGSGEYQLKGRYFDAPVGPELKEWGFQLLSAWSNVSLAPGLVIRLELPVQTQSQCERLEAHLKAKHGDAIQAKFLDKVLHKLAGERK